MEAVSRPRILCVGSNLESRVALEGLLAINANVVGIIVAPRSSRASISDYVDLTPLATDDMTVVETDAINEQQTLDRIAALQPDFIFTLGWSQLFDKPLLDLPRYFVVGSHPSALPAGRGRAPVPWTILEGLSRSAVTLFRMSPGVDDGPILIQRWFEVPPDVYAEDLYRTIADNLRGSFVELYRQIEKGSVSEVPQDPELASYRARRDPTDGLLDFTRPSHELYTLVRAVSRPYPGAYAFHEDRRVSIWRASIDDLPPYNGVPGQILRRSEGRLLVQTGDGPMWIHDLTTSEGKLDPTNLKLGSRFGHVLEEEIVALKEELRQLRSLLEKR